MTSSNDTPPSGAASADVVQPGPSDASRLPTISAIPCSANQTATQPTIGLALGCGGARGLAHIQVLEALDELGLRPSVIAGASIGAILGSACAAGLSGKDIRALVLSSVARRDQLMGRLWKARPTRWAEVMSGGFGFGPYHLERILQGFLPDSVPLDFAGLQTRLTVVATDYYGQSEAHLTEGDLRKAIAASAAIPGLFQPVMVKGRAMVDGGLLNPVPFDVLQGQADIVLGVDVVGGPEGLSMTGSSAAGTAKARKSTPGTDQTVWTTEVGATGHATPTPGRIDAMFGASQLMMQTIIGMKMKAAPPDLLIRPAIHRFRVLDFLRAEEILSATAGTKDEVKRALEAQVEGRLARGAESGCS
ncbi:patatin-like phospholipase family protein [Rhizobium sp. YIM 134829]|uniref:patatin-like phospholipase family protein n=1 Tax=Rhizobium sp. YIM 134829 TaxID=3390453 RepID=UPI00397D1855